MSDGYIPKPCFKMNRKDKRARFVTGHESRFPFKRTSRKLKSRHPLAMQPKDEVTPQ